MIKSFAKITNIFAIALSILAFYVGGWGVFDNIWVSSLTVWFGLMVGLFNLEKIKENEKYFIPIFHAFLAVIFTWIIWKWTALMLEQEEFFIEITFLDDVLAWVGIAVSGYLTLRHFGMPMFIVFLVMLYYVLAPNNFLGAGEDWIRVAENLWYSTDGVFGRPVEVVGRVVLIFILFGTVLHISGAGEVLLKFAFVATGRFSGGPAHAAIVGSAMFGTLSGSPIANVVSTGVFTIPIIKRSGFSAKFAGAVEASASTGGQIMPPVMGVVAFLMADITGIPYLKIVVAALIPAVMYYLSLFIVVYIEAKKRGIEPIPKDQRQVLTRFDWVRSLAFWVPLGTLVYYLLDGRTPQNAGFAATIVAVVLCILFFPAFRHPRKWLEVLITAGKTSATLMIIVSSIGFVIGVVNMTGIGLQFAEAILTVAGSKLFISLLLVMLGCLIMGMGVPTGAAYLIIAIVLGPALERLGLPTIAAHLFVVYFGVLSVVTPPVALAAFAAAPIAGSKPMETGFEAVRLSVAGFIIPFIFVYHQDVLIIVEDFELLGLLWAIFAFLVSTWCIGSGLSGYDADYLIIPERGLRVILGILVLVPNYPISGVCITLAIILIVWHRKKVTKFNKRSNI